MITPEQLAKLREGRCTPDELAHWQTYFQQDDLSALTERLTDDWQQAVPRPPAETAPAQQRVWLRLQGELEAEETPIRTLPSRPVRPVWQWAVAASVALLLLAGSGWLVWNQRWGSEAVGDVATRPEQPKWLLTTNTTNAVQRLTLADGSVVSLQPKSQLRYTAVFSGSLRTVQLAGEAFFSVTPDKAHPFVVQTPSVLVRVLGTSFNVRAFARQKTAEVAVRTGRVSVSPASGKTGLVLAPNEQATLTVANGQLARTLVPQPVVVNPKAIVNQFVFADTPVADVFGELERAYGVTIQYDAQRLASRTLTAKLTDQPLFTKLDMICASIGATYRVNETTIVIE
ncbi:FecR family protein [Fibrella sp. WM1]|uniref:FecR family protein n=1 Tax=Fibrella musci TaxID=3242485 RepID=UPI003522A523